MKALREWLIKHEWFVWFCDPAPIGQGEWEMRAIAPNGRHMLFTGTAAKVSTVRAGDDYISSVI